MDFICFIASKDDSDRRFDKLARRLIPAQSLSSIYKLIRKGLIKLNGLSSQPSTKVHCGDKIEVAAFLISNEDEPLKKDFPIITSQQDNVVLSDVFKNEFIRVINKPYDTLVQGNSLKNKVLCNIVLEEYFKEKNEKSLSFRPGPLHRLDKKTTGILVFSQNLFGARWFSSCLAEHKIKKTYIALLQGRLDDECIWDEAILRKTDNKSKDFFHKSYSSPTGKEALTFVKPLAHGKINNQPITLAQINIETGRTHQIRLHGKIHGHPLAGDTAYGAKAIKANQDFFLHAWKMQFPYPNPINLPENLTAPLPVYFKNIIEKCLPAFDIKPYNI